MKQRNQRHKQDNKCIKLLSAILIFTCFNIHALSAETKNQPPSTKPSPPSKEESNEAQLSAPLTSTIEVKELKDQPSLLSHSPSAQSNSFEQVLKPYTAQYDILSENDKVGTAHRSLKKSSQLWKLQHSTSIRKWYYTYSFEESSTFKIDTSGLKPLHYESITKRSFKDNRIMKSNFDWEKGIETGRKNNKDWTLQLPNAVLDHLSYQLVLRNNSSKNRRKESFRISYKGELETFTFVNEGKEIIDTPIGSFDTVLWVQHPEYKQGKYTYIWLAPKLDYLPVKMTQYRGDEPEGTIRIRSLNWK